jgi:hypothetical protein
VAVQKRGRLNVVFIGGLEMSNEVAGVEHDYSGQSDRSSSG